MAKTDPKTDRKTKGDAPPEGARGPRRSDAVANRERLLEVAREALRESPDASLNSIAKRAGVGAGTLYRHFPNREALVFAVYQDDVEKVSAEAPALLAKHPPVDALRIWFESLSKAIRTKHGLGEALNSPEAEKAIADSYAPVNAAIAELLTAGEAAGELKAGLDPGDVLLLMSFLWRTADDKAGRAQADRTLDLVLAGLRSP
ncbi:MAG TPA: TetR/AcrR family transcriptional regulator [Solirubrobacterales bacterium]|nr:TetR/AcrR family transcriptional regulator [Solirubrobacterales bacterium]